MILVADLPGNLVDRLRRKLECLARLDHTVCVFTRDAEGNLRHFYTAHPRMAADIPERGIELLAPIWHFMDLTPQGRADW